MRNALLVVLLTFTPSTLAAQVSAVEGVDRFELYTACSTMSLLVEGLHDSATDIGLSTEAVERSVRSRLRAARIYAAGWNTPNLYININVTPRAFSVDVAFRKRVHDPLSNLWNVAETWNTGITGTHGGSGGYILQGLAELMDEFIDEYLRVNEQDCTGTLG